MKIMLVNNSAIAIEVGAADGTREVIRAMGGVHGFEPDMETKSHLDILVLTGQYEIKDYSIFLAEKLHKAQEAVDQVKKMLYLAEDQLDEVNEEIRVHQAELDKKAEQEAAALKAEQEAAALKAEQDAAAVAAKKTKKD